MAAAPSPVRSRSPLKGGSVRKKSPWKNLPSLTGGQTTTVPAVVSLVVIAAVFQSQSHFFLSPRNLSNLAVQITIIACIALGEIAVLLLGEIDLSLGSIAGASAAVLAVLLTSAHLAWWLAIFAMLCAGALMGLFQGFWIAWASVPSFVVTLAGLLAYLGVQLQVLGAQGTISIFNPDITDLTSTGLPPNIGWLMCALIGITGAMLAIRRFFTQRQTMLGRREVIHQLGPLAVPFFLAVVTVAVLNPAGGVPTALLVLLGLILAGWWITRWTRPGRHLFAVGGSSEAARRAGIRVRTIRFVAFGASGALAGIGGLMSVAYNGAAGTLTGGGELLLDAIGAAVIGGTSLFGGEGTVWAALFGSLVMGGVANGLDLTNHSAPVKYIVQGAIVLLAVGLDTAIRRRRRAGTTTHG